MPDKPESAPSEVPSDEPAKVPSDDPAKDKFREALERKRALTHANNGDAHGDSKVHGEHSRVGAKRTFRRKSGG